MPNLRPLAFVLLIATLVFTLDCASKAWATEALPDGAQVVIPHALELVYRENPGIAFSMFAGSPAVIRLGLLPALALATALLFLVRGARPSSRPASRVGAALVIGGAVGNAIDRVRLGHVVDFIHAHAGEFFDYPVFNVADMAVLIGIAMLVFDARERRTGSSG